MRSKQQGIDYQADIYFREEDAGSGLHVATHAGPESWHPEPSATQVEVTTSQHGNPSLRRDGIRIAFACENCTTLPDLTIVQHKGATQLQWEYESPFPQMTEQTRPVETV